jgi:Pyruvate kinase, barrel domain
MLPPHLLRGEYTLSERATCIQLQDITTHFAMARKTKILCTMGPACSSKEGITVLLDAGMNIARLNFSHGDHASHLRTLQEFRCAPQPQPTAVLLGSAETAIMHRYLP